MADSIGGFGMMDYSQIQRLMAVTDEMNRNMTKLVTDIEVLKLQVSDLQKRFTELEDRTALTPPVSWQSWAVAVVGLIMAVVMLLSLANLR